MIFLALGVLVYLMYFTNPGHFFQADTTFWFDHRLRSLGEFVRSFGGLDAGGWYRPLTNPTIESLFFPLFGFNPAPYRLIVAAFFLTDALLVWALARKVTDSKLAAAVACLFFSTHTVNAYITYDVAFMPELALVGFYITAVLSFLHYTRTRSKGAYAASLAAAALCFLSKEPSVTLPFMLVAAQVIVARQWTWRAFRSLIPHFMLLGLYLAFVIGRLGVATQAFDPDGVAFSYSLDSTLADNFTSAVTWAMNLPRGVHTQFRGLSADRFRFYVGFAILVGFLAVAAIRKKGRPILFGLAWFCATMGPMLPLRGHFLPYYLFLPIAGFSIVIGVALEYGYLRLAQLHRPAATGALVVVLATLIAVSAITVRYDINDNCLMGDSARAGLNSVRDMKRLYPTLPRGATVYIDDSMEAIWWNHASGGLFRLAYGDDTLQFRYASLGEEKPPDVIVIRHLRGGVLQKIDYVVVVPIVPVHAGGSLAGNESSEAESTGSSDRIA